jgi:hypothetical protein
VHLDPKALEGYEQQRVQRAGAHHPQQVVGLQGAGLPPGPRRTRSCAHARARLRGGRARAVARLGARAGQRWRVAAIRLEWYAGLGGLRREGGGGDWAVAQRVHGGLLRPGRLGGGHGGAHGGTVLREGELPRVDLRLLG